MSALDVIDSPAAAPKDSSTGEPATAAAAAAELVAPPAKKGGPLSVTEKLDKAKEYKEKGNDLFKAGDFKKVQG